jgi:heme-degrading monooxygenase HmoA
VQKYVKTLPGFVEGFVYENQDGGDHSKFLTIAVWKDQEALENAKRAVALENQRQGVNPQEVIKSMRIESARALYERSPY